MTGRTLVGCTALLLLCIAGLSLGAGRSDVADAVMKGDKASLTRLLQQKADVNAAQIDGATAFHWAVYRNDLEVANLLIRAGAKVNVAQTGTQLPSRMDTLEEPSLAVARSCLPSPLKSPTATETGEVPTVKLVAVIKDPLPVPSRMDTLLEPRLAVARSLMPSPLKSPTAAETGEVPAP